MRIRPSDRNCEHWLGIEYEKYASHDCGLRIVAVVSHFALCRLSRRYEFPAGFSRTLGLLEFDSNPGRGFVGELNAGLNGCTRDGCDRIQGSLTKITLLKLGFCNQS